MAPKLTDEQRLALESRPGQPVEIEDDHTQRVYILVARDDFQSLCDERLRRELEVGFEQADRATWQTGISTRCSVKRDGGATRKRLTDGAHPPHAASR
jgi:hypothetical protein